MSQQENKNNPYFKEGVDPNKKVEITQQTLWDICLMCYKDGRLNVLIEYATTGTVKDVYKEEKKEESNV